MKAVSGKKETRRKHIGKDFVYEYADTILDNGVSLIKMPHFLSWSNFPLRILILKAEVAFSLR